MPQTLQLESLWQGLLYLKLPAELDAQGLLGHADGFIAVTQRRIRA